MLPEKRRAGRAIRKARRQEADERALSELDDFLRAIGQVANYVAGAFEGVGKALIAMAEVMRTMPARNEVSLPPSLSAVGAARSGAHHPSQVGVYRVTEAHSAPDDDNPYEGMGT